MKRSAGVSGDSDESSRVVKVVEKKQGRKKQRAVKKNKKEYL